MKKVLSFLLAFSFILSLIPSQVVVAESPFTIFLDKAKFYQEIIKRDVPGCLWNKQTELSKTTALYDPNGQLNGCIFEYINGKTPVGYIQISNFSGKPVLDSYALEGHHWATKLSKADRLVRLGALAYYEAANHGRLKSIDTQEYLSLETASAVYTQFANSISSNIESPSNTYNTKSMYTQTVLAKGYSGGLTLATYSNTGDTGGAGCARIAAVNCCLYWAKCRGKAGLYSSNPSTYRAISNYIIYGGEGDVHSSLYNGLRQYMISKGYTPTVRGIVSANNGDWRWGTLIGLIDQGVPPVLIVQMPAGAGHAVLMLGYQHIDIVNTFIVADGKSSSYSFYSTAIYKPRAQYSSYNGW